MNNIRIGVRLITAFVMVAVLAMVVGLVGYSGIMKAENALETITREDVPSIEALAQVRFNMRNVIVAQRTLLVRELSAQDREQQYKNIEEARKIYREAMARYEAVPKSPEETKLLQDLKSILAQAAEQNTEGFALLKDSAADPTNEAKYSKAVTHIINKSIDVNRALFDTLGQLIIQAKKESEENSKKGIAEADSSLRTMTIVAVLAPLLGLLLGFLLTRSLTRPLGVIVSFSESVAQGNLKQTLEVRQNDELGKLSDSLRHMVQNLNAKIAESDEKSVLAAEEARKAQIATQEANEAKAQAERAKAQGMIEAARQLEQVVEVISSASEQLSAQVEQSSRGSEVQASRVAETATAMEEMNSTVLEVARNASQAAESTESARKKAGEGSKVVGQVVAGINTMQSVSMSLKEDMGQLGKQAEGIGQIMNVISDIADQTNLLALNA
ncbi:MAG: methyl-accepting chemotaxis protein, partial [Humidesulfovibrio sp.]|uniref:methyl-accepting chemotaxis protein n=1 Tax=Humidesulfovibrio sp. TaxID=2910988 RepID=UPI002733DEFA